MKKIYYVLMARQRGTKRRPPGPWAPWHTAALNETPMFPMTCAENRNRPRSKSEWAVFQVDADALTLYDPEADPCKDEPATA